VTGPDRNPTWLWTSVPHQDEEMNIVVPVAEDEGFGWIHKAMRLNLLMQGISPTYVDLKETLDADFAYDRLIRNLWRQGDPFVLVEHDILPWPGAILQLWECEHPWCGFEYMVKGELRSYLGCVKFDPSRLGPCPLPTEPLVWTSLDLEIIRTLSERGHPGHLHRPAVAHLNYGHQRITNRAGVMRPDWMAPTERGAS